MQRDRPNGGTSWVDGSPAGRRRLLLGAFLGMLAAGLLGAEFGLLLDWLRWR